MTQPAGRPGEHAVYSRMLLKLSGEALMGPQSYGIHEPVVATIADEVRDIHSLGVETAIVVGGGNIIRGLAASHRGIDRVTGDYMGMLATVINALALQDALEKREVPTRVQTAIDIRELAAKSEKITGRSGSILTELAHSMTQTMSIVRDVSTAAADQSTGIAEITTAMRQVNEVAAQNSVAAEDLAATAQEMSAQAEAMQALVGFFREAEDPSRPSAALAALAS